MTVYRVIKSAGIEYRYHDLMNVGKLCAEKAREIGLGNQIIKIKEKQGNRWFNRINDYPESFEATMQDIIIGYFTSKIAA